MTAENAARAALDSGDLLLEAGDVAGARAAYERATQSGDPDQAPRALKHSANADVTLGLPDGAKRSGGER